jgi:tetratricopeptide (TPR) repeat protein
MSLLSSFTKKSKLSATIKQTQQARKSEGNAADQLFKSAYAGYAEVLLDDPIRADALYNWGFALLHQAKTKEGAQAEAIYQDAINKFAFCLLINPNYLGAAINGGVAYMDLARLKGAAPDDVLYTLAQKHFEAANKIQTGTASYNLACIYALRGDSQACLQAFELSKERGSLPDASDIMQDPDLATVKEADWFLAFIEPLLQLPEPRGLGLS